ncbi:MAG: HNH nuclease family protein [Methylococcaceae bacterium]|nr:HNH nuclease family protein [Methylococcaceae bacterium]
MKTNQTQAAGNQIIAEARRYKEDREKGYREQALKLYPWVCGRCAREFIHKNLLELTVHHKNHNHDDNPANGSNWELLCLYCHDNEHSRYEEQVRYGNNDSGSSTDNSGGTHNPFANLKGLLANKSD